MPIEIRVVDFDDQTGETEAAATAALLAQDPDVLVSTTTAFSDSVAEGLVISQEVLAVSIEEAGGDAGSHGTRIVLTISLGPEVPPPVGLVIFAVRQGAASFSVV